MTGAERGWAWVEHLRSGGSTPWQDFAGSERAAVPRAGTRLLPGAIQRSACSSAQGSRSGGSSTLRDLRPPSCPESSMCRIMSSCGCSPLVRRLILRLSRRSSSVSAMPSEAFERSLSRGAHAGSKPNAWQKRSHRSSGPAPDGGTVTTCTRSGGRPRDQLPRTVGRSKARMNQGLPLSAMARNRRNRQVRPCFTLSCQAAGSCRARSRAL